MSGGFTTTVFEPDPSCFDPTNLWIKTQPCTTWPVDYDNLDTRDCRYFHHGPERLVGSTAVWESHPCYPNYETSIIYTDCPSGYSAARETGYGDGYKSSFETVCCPTGYEYQYGSDPFPSDWDGESMSFSLSRQPGCRATGGVDVLISQIVTVTVGNYNDGEAYGTTDWEWRDDDAIFAHELTVFGPTIWYSPEESTCWHNCPFSYKPTPTFPDEIETAPAVTAPPIFSSCVDPNNKWLVTTSCYLDENFDIYTPDWLTCAVTNLGPPVWDDPCYDGIYSNPYTIKDDTTTWYSGCPSGYTTAEITSYGFLNTYEHPLGYYDVTTYSGMCCPTEYDFRAGDVRKTRTVHDGATYSLFVYPPPACYATSIKELSGSEVVLSQWSNTQGWDKRQENPPTTVTWNYETDTMYAMGQRYAYEVWMGTHTCYSQWYSACDSWADYYYPDGTGGPTPSNALFGFGSGSPTPVRESRSAASTGVQPGSGTGAGTGSAEGSQGTPSPTGAGSRTFGANGMSSMVLGMLTAILFSGRL